MTGYAEFVRHDKDGYELLTDPDVPHRRATSITHHRLIAYAHGELNDLREPVEIDHLDCIPWANYADALEAVGPIEHGRRTRKREDRRKNRV